MRYSFGPVAGCMTRANRRDQLGPPGFLVQELSLALRRDPIELRALVRVRLGPLRRHPAALRQPLEGRVQRAGFNLQDLGRLGADRLRDGVAVLRSPLERSQDQHVERSVDEIGPCIGPRRMKRHVVESL